MRGSVALHCKTNPCLPQWKTSWRKTISFPRTRTLRHRCDRYIFFGICFGMLRWVRQSPRLRNSIFCVSFLWWVLFIKSRNAVCRIRGTLISGRCPISALLLPASCIDRRDKSIEEIWGRSANHFELYFGLQLINVVLYTRSSRTPQEKFIVELTQKYSFLLLISDRD